MVYSPPPTDVPGGKSVGEVDKLANRFCSFTMGSRYDLNHEENENKLSHCYSHSGKAQQVTKKNWNSFVFIMEKVKHSDTYKSKGDPWLHVPWASPGDHTVKVCPKSPRLQVKPNAGFHCVRSVPISCVNVWKRNRREESIEKLDFLNTSVIRSYLPRISLNRGSSSIWYLSRYSKSSSVPRTLAMRTNWS